MTGKDLVVLAVHEDSNANASLLVGDRIVACVAEERLTREKFQGGFPANSVAEVLRIARLQPADVDLYAAGNRFHFLPRLPLGLRFVEGEHDLFGFVHKAWLAAQGTFVSEGLIPRGIEFLNRQLLGRRLGHEVTLIDHHTCHAWSAWLTSGFDEALAVSIDNMGDGYSARVFRCGAGKCEPLWGSNAVQSPGQFYGEISQYLGFHVLMAGKVTGLAASGDWRRLYPVMEKLFALSADRKSFILPRLWSKSRTRGLFAELAGQSPADIAAAAQRRLEDVVVEFVAHALKETGLRHLVLAGGVFANVLLNSRLWCLPEVEGVFVHPAMSDQGISLGAGLGVLASKRPVRPKPIADVYLGPEYTEEQMGQELEASGVRYTRVSDPEAEVARLVVEKKVVARFAGRMEYGPRALGNRSILYQTIDPTVNDWLNKRLKRSEFMPFAPATLSEMASTCYSGYGSGVEHTSQFMTMTFPCTDYMKKRSPAVVHIDGTARPQVVHEAASPDYYRIIKLVYEATGTPSIVNTSFNMHGEPIVCSPQDAIRSFLEGHLDVLVMGPFVVEGQKTGLH